MAKGKRESELVDAERAPVQKAVLFEIAGQKRADQRNEGRTLRIAALSLEEVIRYVRTDHSDLEITEIRVVGAIQVLSSSENL
jgi:hypothetical protein